MNANQEMVEKAEEFLRRYYAEDLAELANHYPKDEKSLYIEYGDLFKYDPDLADDLQNHPREIFRAFEEAVRLYDLPVDVDLSGVHVRFRGFPDEELLDVASVARRDNLGRQIALRGQVQKVSDAKPRVESGAFVCQRCGAETIVPQSGEELQEPYQCESCERQGPFKLNMDRTEWVDHQLARIQQPPERTKGGNSQTVDVSLADDLIEEFTPGDRVRLAGILELEDPTQTKSRSFETQLDTRGVTREESDYEDIDVDEYREEIEAIAGGERGDPYELLVDSINPRHEGDEDVKLAIALQLFGGWPRNGLRGDSHVLLIGDPGCGKSTFLQAVDELAPRSTYASGKGATAAGLTAAAVADDFGSTEWGLEAGALVLADGGIACIDEIDKVSGEAVSSLHDALASQKVRVNKAGINATLSARTALLAAGNPREGRFDQYQPLAQQIDLNPTLMSRFDLMFMVSDNPDEEADRAVVEHMMRSRRAGAKNFHGEELTEEEAASITPAISHDVLRAYIAHAKETCFPYLTEESEEARRHLTEEFLGLRLANEDAEDNPVPVTYRQEEAIERLAEASARVRLSEEVETEDVERALELVRTSMEQVGIDPETGEYDADIVETGQSKNQRDRIKSILAVVEEQGEVSLEELKEILSRIEDDRIEEDVENLKQKGRLYEPEEGVLRVS